MQIISTDPSILLALPVEMVYIRCSTGKGGLVVTMAQIMIVDECNEAMRYFAARATRFEVNDWREESRVKSYCRAEFLQVQMLRDFIRFGR